MSTNEAERKRGLGGHTDIVYSNAVGRSSPLLTIARQLLLGGCEVRGYQCNRSGAVRVAPRRGERQIVRYGLKINIRNKKLRWRQEAMLLRRKCQDFAGESWPGSLMDGSESREDGGSECKAQGLLIAGSSPLTRMNLCRRSRLRQHSVEHRLTSHSCMGLTTTRFGLSSLILHNGWFSASPSVSPRC